MIQLDTKCSVSSHHRIALSVIQEKNFNCQVHEDMKLRACSHEPGTMNCPGASVTSRSHDDLLSLGNVDPGQLHCPGESSRSSDHYEII